ncbi:hypothetical protein ISN45_Aa04g019710 [Arabidopsis thaliana x Arabidopsis arenosa]|uniref:Uncharacterized protein n=1 Tax=Arabidopsis thaliana x Arabidopsis arenosa TaxID=1240361 RepID=A0A8T2A7W4_9BRAS|nr:hypothetical protein ISN45_Aa04g019710 [Arabidopsis thaliana x Arabidopsis arenosa]
MRESEGKHDKPQMNLRFDEGGGSVWQRCSRHEGRFVCVGGICPYCLHERLSSLCPDCAHDLPCSCTPRASVSSVGGDDVPFAGIGSVGRVANLIESESAFRRSTSVPYFWSSKPETILETESDLKPGRGRWLWRLFRGNREETKIKAATVMKKSNSVAGEVLFSPAPVTSKGNGWYFPSPIKVFRQSRVSKMIFQQRSPLYRG